MSYVHQILKMSRRHIAVRPERHGPSARSVQTDGILLRQTIDHPTLASPSAVLSLQRAYGNHAITHLIQAKLTIGPPGDRYEREADRVAEQIMQMGDSAAGPMGQSAAGVQREEVQMQPLAATITPLVQRQEEEEEIQAKSQIPIRRQEEEEEEVQAKFQLPIQRQKEEEEEEVQTKPQFPIQRQEEEEEEEVQTKPQFPIQRQEEEEEEEVQAKSQFPIQRQEEEEEEVQAKFQLPIQRQEEEEEEEVQTKPQFPIRRQEEEEEEVQAKSQFPIRRQEEEEEVQAKSRSPNVQLNLEQRLATQKGKGRPLSAEVRAFMEPRFGADFSGVRIHTDGEATRLNRALRSKAFTHGQDIYFQSGEYNPDTPAGQRLLAHELTHTIQQGAVSGRIQGWWPKGHRLITELALREGKFQKSYSKAARAFLIDRSPDIDFIQDEFDTMNEGIQEAASILERYNKLAISDPAAAQRMYQNNELHKRRPAYALSHGEAGLYKESDAAAKNEAVTSRMVDKAISLWNWDDGNSWGRSLSVLSDALHQAADRGAHGEGNAFSGHDVRIRLGKHPWEKRGQQIFKARSGDIEPSKWEPDNISINRRGAALAVGFVQGALKKFEEGVKTKTGAPESKAMIRIAIKRPPKRVLRILAGKQALLGSSGFERHFAGKTGGGMGTLKKILKESKKDRWLKKQYKAALASPQVRESLDRTFRTGLLEEGITFYEVGARLFSPEDKELFDEQLQTHRQLFGEWKSRESYAVIKQRYRERYQSVVGQYEGREQEVVASALRTAYHIVFRRPPWDPYDNP